MSEPNVNTSLEVIAVTPHPGGRPSSFRQDIADEICDRIAEGSTITSICEDDEMPALRTVYKWIDRYPEFGQAYGRARARQAFTLTDEAMDIAADKSILPDRARNMIDIRKWKAAKQNWRYFGDKVQIDVKESAKELAPEELPGGLGFLARARLERGNDDA